MNLAPESQRRKLVPAEAKNRLGLLAGETTGIEVSKGLGEVGLADKVPDHAGSSSLAIGDGNGHSPHHLVIVWKGVGSRSGAFLPFGLPLRAG